VQSHAEHDPLVLGLFGIGLSDDLLELDGGPERIYGTRKLGQNAVAVSFTRRPP
jgi:hypothetical protein